MQRAGKIIGGAGGNVAHGDVQLCQHKAGDGFVKGAVSPYCDNQIKVFGVLLCIFFCDEYMY